MASYPPNNYNGSLTEQLSEKYREYGVVISKPYIDNAKAPEHENAKEQLFYYGVKEGHERFRCHKVVFKHAVFR